MTVVIESLDREGRGIARVEGKAIFIEGGLPGEMVSYSSYRRKPSYEQAIATAIHAPSAERELPRCPHFGVCGGCSMQHLEARAQVAVKQRVLEDSLWHIGKLRPETMLRAVYGLAWGYRQRARLSVRLVPKKGGVLVGFHERKSSFVADMRSCEILPRRISGLLPPLRTLIAGLSNPARLPQIELAAGEAVTVLVLRILDPLSPADEDTAAGFCGAARHPVLAADQRAGYGRAVLSDRCAAALLRAARVRGADSLPAYRFHPGESCDQPHSGAPRAGPARSASGRAHRRPVLRPRELQPADRQPRRRGAGHGRQCRTGEVAPKPMRAPTDWPRAHDFSLPIYSKRRGCVELGGFDKLLIDPPRDGAVEVVKALGDGAPRRIVYVSCDPATLARDAEVLVHVKGYRLTAAGVINMFPHTSHVESMALFER